jgi:hypothetical protein
MDKVLLAPPILTIINFNENITKLDPILISMNNPKMKPRLISVTIKNSRFPTNIYFTNRVLKKYDYTCGISKIILQNVKNIDIKSIFDYLIYVSSKYGSNNYIKHRSKNFNNLVYLHIEHILSTIPTDSLVINSLVDEMFNNDSMFNYCIQDLIIIGKGYFSELSSQVKMSNCIWLSNTAKTIIINENNWDETDIIYYMLLTFKQLSSFEISNSYLGFSIIKQSDDFSVSINNNIKSLVFNDNTYNNYFILYHQLFSKIDFIALKTLNLGSTKLNNNWKLNDITFNLIILNCKFLSVIVLDYCVLLSDDTLMLLTNCKAYSSNYTLKSISMVGCSALTVNGVKNFIKSIIELCSNDQMIPIRSLEYLDFTYINDFNKVEDMMELQLLKIQLFNGLSDNYKCILKYYQGITFIYILLFYYTYIRCSNQKYS